MLTNIEDVTIEKNHIEILGVFKYILKQTDNFFIPPYNSRTLLWSVMEEIIQIISVKNFISSFFTLTSSIQTILNKVNK